MFTGRLDWSVVSLGMVAVVGCGGTDAPGNVVAPDLISAAHGVVRYEVSFNETSQQWRVLPIGENKTLAEIMFDKNLDSVVATSTFEDHGTQLIRANMDESVTTGPDGTQTNTMVVSTEFIAITFSGTRAPNNDFRGTLQSTIGDPAPLVVFESVGGVETDLDDTALAAWKQQASFNFLLTPPLHWTDVALSDANVLELVAPPVPATSARGFLTTRPAHLDNFCRFINNEVNRLGLLSSAGCASCFTNVGIAAASAGTLGALAIVGCGACAVRMGFGLAQVVYCKNQAAKATSNTTCASKLCPVFAVPIATPDEHDCKCQCDPNACLDYCVHTNDSNFSGTCSLSTGDCVCTKQ